MRQQVVAAALYEHAHGIELRVYVEPEEDGQVLRTYVDALIALEGRANALRDMLCDQGWQLLAIE